MDTEKVLQNSALILDKMHLSKQELMETLSFNVIKYTVLYAEDRLFYLNGETVEQFPIT